MSEIGLFPLGIVLLPTEQVPLHIFEDRYKELIAECLADNEEFGLVYADTDGIREIGTRAAVVEVLARLEDGRMNVLVEGRDRFKVLELTRGRLHGDLWFALGWGAFPVLTAYWANALSFGPAALVAAAYAVALSYAQRRLSMWVRLVRRRTERVEGAMVVEGGRRALDAPTLIAASDSALRWLSLASVLIALAVLLVRLYH